MIATKNGGKKDYQTALAELAQATRNAREMAELLVYFAGLLRGEGADPDGPFVEAMPSSSRVARAMERRERAREQAEREWEALPADIRDGLSSPEEMMEGEE